MSLILTLTTNGIKNVVANSVYSVHTEKLVIYCRKNISSIELCCLKHSQGMPGSRKWMRWRLYITCSRQQAQRPMGSEREQSNSGARNRLITQHSFRAGLLFTHGSSYTANLSHFSIYTESHFEMVEIYGTESTAVSQRNKTFR